MKNNDKNNEIEIEKNLGDDVSDNLKDYYRDLSQKIITYIKDNKLKEAIELIEQEIESPYVPNSVLLMLTESRNELEWQLKQQEYEKAIKNMTPLQMWDKVYNAKTGFFDAAYFNVLLEKKDNILDKVDYEIINKILLDKKVANINKVVIAMSLNKLEIDHEFKVFNNCLDKEFSVNFKNTADLNLPSEALVKKAEDVFMKEPSKFQLFLNLVQLLYAWYFPTKIPQDDDLVVKTIANVIEDFFQGKKSKPNEITRIIYKMLEENNETN